MAGSGSQRLDKWLFFARVVKSRALAQKLIQSGAVRVNAVKTDQPSRAVRPGDGLTIALERQILVYRVLDAGARRGPAEEARGLYEDLTPAKPPPAERPVIPAEREPGSGRPTKRERRMTDRFREQE